MQNRILKQVGNIADKGDVVACHLISIWAVNHILKMYTENKDKELSEEDREKLSLINGVYKNYSSKSIEAGYWPAAFSKCFTLEIILDGGDRNKNIEKYGWMFENVEWFNIQTMLGHNYLSLDINDNKYYKNAVACFLKAYRLQKDNSLCGYLSFFLNAGVIGDSEIDGINKKSIKFLYYKGLDSKGPASLQKIGDLYFTGIGDEHLGIDKKAAYEYYEKTYDNYDNIGDFPGKSVFDTGKSSTAYILGYMTFNGIGTKKDEGKAVYYYEDAVQRGEKRAIQPLADCYKNGIGVDKDMNRYNELISMI